jgi:hypothetical protein
MGTLTGFINEVPASFIGRVDPPAALASALCLAVYVAAPDARVVSRAPD